MRKLSILLFAIVVLLASLTELHAQKQVERLSRGLIAVRQNQGYHISWRLLGNEPYETGFNVYRGNLKLNEEPITNVTSYYDAGSPINSIYYVRAIIDGEEKADKKYARIMNYIEGSNAGYFDILLKKPARGKHGGTYSPGDASTGDLTGDGEYDIVLKWDPSNAKDNSHSGTTDNVLLDAYTLRGEHLWRIDLGPNIRAGAHYTQFLVFDFDGNGRAEIMVKTAPGTKDATGNYISMGPAGFVNHENIYRNSSGYILSGPEYISVFDGSTGKELATELYWPSRGTVSSWGDNYGNRLDRYNATVAYVDGERPSGVFQRGYYTRMTFAAWDWRDGKFVRRWVFDSNGAGNGTYAGNGNHSIHVIDANGDGKHDIVTGSAVISGDGKGMHTTRMGHGDATHVTYMKKGDPRPMIYMPHESGGHGVSLRYADNGQMLFNHKASGDIGRGCAGELDPNKPGFHFWASSGLGLYNLEGNRVGNVPNSVNFVIWWDGNLSRELMNGNSIDRWSIASNSSSRLLSGSNAGSINGSKSTPVLQADLFGDWREEVILRRNDDAALRVYTSIMPTTHKLYTFMHDPIYRVAVSWQNSSYNQPPHPGFYVATDMDFPLAMPNVAMVDGFNRGSGSVFKDLMVYDDPNADSWKIMSDLNTSTSIYGDRTFYASEMPEYMLGAEWIRTSYESGSYAKTESLSKFSVSRDALVYVVHNSTADNTPEWLSGFSLKSEKVMVSVPGQAKVEMSIYEKGFSEGDVVALGSIENNMQMYFVASPSIGTSKRIESVIESKNQLNVYPNPLTQFANISFDLENDARVFIEVLDLSGRQVQVLENSYKDSGNHTISFDGSKLPGGIYVVRMQTGNQFAFQKIVLTK